LKRRETRLSNGDDDDDDDDNHRLPKTKGFGNASNI